MAAIEHAESVREPPLILRMGKASIAAHLISIAVIVATILGPETDSSSAIVTGAALVSMAVTLGHHLVWRKWSKKAAEDLRQLMEPPSREQAALWRQLVERAPEMGEEILANDLETAIRGLPRPAHEAILRRLGAYLLDSPSVDNPGDNARQEDWARLAEALHRRSAAQ